MLAKYQTDVGGEALVSDFSPDACAYSQERFVF